MQMTFLDRLADIEHRQWAQWAQKLIDTEPGLSVARAKRWRELIATPYSELSDEWKEFDRDYARLVLREVRLQLDEEHLAFYGDSA